MSLIRVGSIASVIDETNWARLGKIATVEILLRPSLHFNECPFCVCDSLHISDFIRYLLAVSFSDLLNRADQNIYTLDYLLDQPASTINNAQSSKDQDDYGRIKAIAQEAFAGNDISHVGGTDDTPQVNGNSKRTPNRTRQGVDCNGHGRLTANGNGDGDGNNDGIGDGDDAQMLSGGEGNNKGEAEEGEEEEEWIGLSN